MKIAILSSGPSVVDSWNQADKDSYDVTIGISTTCWYIDVDWMCWMDGIVIRGMIERNRKPKVGCVWHVSDLRFWPELEHSSYPTYLDGTKPEYTLPNAINWALNTFETPHIEIFGNDMDDRPSISGSEYNHNETRWIDELSQIERVISEHKLKISEKSKKKLDKER